MNDLYLFPCPGCGRQLKAPPHAVGRKGRCACGSEFIVPALLSLDDPEPPVVDAAKKPPMPEPSSRRLPANDLVIALGFAGAAVASLIIAVFLKEYIQGNGDRLELQNKKLLVICVSLFIGFGVNFVTCTFQCMRHGIAYLRTPLSRKRESDS